MARNVPRNSVEPFLVKPQRKSRIFKALYASSVLAIPICGIASERSRDCSSPWRVSAPPPLTSFIVGLDIRRSRTGVSVSALICISTNTKNHYWGRIVIKEKKTRKKREGRETIENASSIYRYWKYWFVLSNGNISRCHYNSAFYSCGVNVPLC